MEYLIFICKLTEQPSELIASTSPSHSTLPSLRFVSTTLAPLMYASTLALWCRSGSRTRQSYLKSPQPRMPVQAGSCIRQPFGAFSHKPRLRLINAFGGGIRRLCCYLDRHPLALAELLAHIFTSRYKKTKISKEKYNKFTLHLRFLY